MVVHLRWDPRLFGGDRLDRVAHCVTVGGEPIEAASGVETPSANDGEYRATFTVPAAPPGTCFCVRGVVAGEGPDGRRERAGDVPACLTVVGPPPGPPATSPITTAPSRPAAEVSPPAGNVDSVTTTNPAPPAVLPATVTKPAPLKELLRILDESNEIDHGRVSQGGLGDPTDDDRAGHGEPRRPRVRPA